MLTLFKFLFIADFIKSNKKTLFYIVVLIVLLLILPYLFEDLFQLINQKDKAFWVLAKWLMLFLLILCIVYKCFKIFKRTVLRINGPLEKSESDNIHKNLIKKTLHSKGEKIKNKYRLKQ